MSFHVHACAHHMLCTLTHMHTNLYINTFCAPHTNITFILSHIHTLQNVHSTRAHLYDHTCLPTFMLVNTYSYMHICTHTHTCSQSQQLLQNSGKGLPPAYYQALSPPIFLVAPWPDRNKLLLHGFPPPHFCTCVILHVFMYPYTHKKAENHTYGGW